MNTQFSNEYYVCPKCDKKFESKNVRQNWKCPDCDELLSIYTTDDNHVYRRKFAEDVIEGDMVKLPFSKSFHRVLDTRYKDGKYRIALKGHGVVSLDDDDWLNCGWGSWDGDVSLFRL